MRKLCHSTKSHHKVRHLLFDLLFSCKMQTSNSSIIVQTKYKTLNNKLDWIYDIQEIFRYFCTELVTLQTSLYSLQSTVQLRLSINNCSHMDCSGLRPNFGKINIKCMGKLWDCRMKTLVFAATEIVVTLNKFSFNQAIM